MTRTTKTTTTIEITATTTTTTLDDGFPVDQEIQTQTRTLEVGR